MSRVYRISFALIILLTYSIAFAYDDKVTHPSITEKAIEASHLDKYLSEVLGFENELDTTFSLVTNSSVLIEPILDIPSWIENPYPDKYYEYPGYSIKDLMVKGGSVAEDTPACRANNHFYDPIKGGCS